MIEKIALFISAVTIEFDFWPDEKWRRKAIIIRGIAILIRARNMHTI
jgi:hypothetical protein